MTTTTRTRIPTWQIPAIDARAAELNARFATRNIPGAVTVTYTDPYVVRDDLGIEHTYVDVTIDVTATALPGGWTLTAIGDFQLGDTPIVTRFDDSTTPVTQACDHCQTNRRRNFVFVVTADDGRRMQVGSTCIADFLGHNVNGLLAFPEAIGGIDDELFDVSGGPVTVPLIDWVAAAWTAVQIDGWRRSSEIDSTRQAASTILFGPADVIADWFGDRIHDPAVVANAHAHAAAAIAWAAEMTPRSEFDRNMRTIAVAGAVTPKGASMGIAAYLPVAYARHLDQQACRAAEEAAAPAPTAAPEGRTEVVGTVIGMKWQDSDYGCTLKVTVLDDRGFKVWSTAPAAIADDVERGDRVRFTATLTRSDRDATFAFGKRPSKAELLAAA